AMRKRIKVDRLKQKKLGNGIHVTRNEVFEFYEQYKDSLPPIPETFELYQIVRTPGLSDEAKKLAYDKTKSLLDSNKMGAEFSDIARKYSDDSTSAVHRRGLGQVKKGVR